MNKSGFLVSAPGRTRRHFPLVLDVWRRARRRHRCLSGPAMTHIVGAHLAMRKIAPLHRATTVEVDEASAPEGGKFIPGSEEMTQGRGPIPKTRKVPRNRKPVASFWWAAFLVGSVVFGGVIGWHVAARLVQHFAGVQ